MVCSHVQHQHRLNHENVRWAVVRLRVRKTRKRSRNPRQLKIEMRSLDSRYFWPARPLPQQPLPPPPPVVVRSSSHGADAAAAVVDIVRAIKDEHTYVLYTNKARHS